MAEVGAAVKEGEDHLIAYDPEVILTHHIQRYS
jgi:hypothetical protein